MPLLILMLMITLLAGFALFVWSRRKETTIGYGPGIMALIAHAIVLFGVVMDTAKRDEMDALWPVLVALVALAIWGLGGLWAIAQIIVSTRNED